MGKFTIRKYYPMVKNLSRRTVKLMNVLCLSLAAIFFLSFLPPISATSPTHAVAGFPSVSDASSISSVPLVSAASSSMIDNRNFTKDNTSFSYADSSRLNLLYDSLQLDSLGLSFEAWHKAVMGFLNMIISGAIHNPGVLSIIDFSRPSTQKRLFVLDMFSGALLFNTLVAHGRNSGVLLATRFSNRRNSYMSSLGFYLTGEPFIGQHGYSLRLEGIEKGWNDNAFHRSIIMHPADYVSEEHIRQWGYLGRSEGCPAIPEDLDRPIIDSIRGGSCLFIYSPNHKYLHRSRLTS